MSTANTISELKKMIEKLAKEAMVKGNSVKNTVIEEGKKNIDEMVYSYEPKQYDRTYQLRDESWEYEKTADGIAIVNTRRDEDTGKYIPSVIESGKGYDYTGYGYDYEKPRKFMERTHENLEGSNKLAESLKKDMKSIGLDVE